MSAVGFPVTAHLLVTGTCGRILLLRNARDHGRWQLPGGRVEPGEAPSAAVEREAFEEIGLRLPSGPLLVVAWTAASRSGRRDRYAFLFATAAVERDRFDMICLQRREVDRWQLAEPGIADTLLHPLMVERVRVASGAGAATIYLEQRGN